MKILIIHGQSHEGSTCMAARKIADKVGGEIKEFFLPRDFNKSCLGCYTCFKTDLSHCPHFKELEPLVTAILDADLLILESPVYVYHATGPMMSFLDHFGTWWVIHRPLPEMSGKQAVAISYIITAILGLAAVLLTSSGELKALILIGAVLVVGTIGLRKIFKKPVNNQTEETASEDHHEET